ncbi:uncharacterized protein PHALS_06767 [Plasmopara halstedii]|uniref:Uncharacterized protein n=1 Tax=Plasmopara halstedii TaxID=4781 RepID=A0A0P1B5M0_PLAHL|nr:uncharacterized protein PHALS_06767 [Plasmopara halstedii]CEG48977.1 hypothetical protein PHALS_06767 [Plasmopara halstedii]|eukprot:XP_024585346.1 hypothetical protein PHALS_06767 [Plasmopara halstedii]
MGIQKGLAQWRVGPVVNVPVMLSPRNQLQTKFYPMYPVDARKLGNSSRFQAHGGYRSIETHFLD